jgi:hypothetical protein
MNDHVWPLVGVFLGWILSSIATGWKIRETDRRNIGKLLAKLIRILGHLQTLRAASETFKATVNGWPEYERIRQKITEKHFLEPVVDLEKLNAAVDEISGFLPIESLQLRQLIDILGKAKAANFKASAENHDLYVRMLSVHEVGLDASEKALTHSVRALAWKHSVVTYVQVLFKIRKSRKGIAQNEQFMKRFSDETWALLEDIQNRSPTPHAPDT